MNNLTYLKQLMLYTMSIAILTISKELLSFLPNIEIVSFLFILYALYYPLPGSLLVSFGFNLIQIILYGVGLWTPVYFIIWPFLIIITYVVRLYLTTEYRCAMLSAIFGLSFGFFTALPYFVISIQTGWIYFLKGLPFDFIHATSNYIIMIVLFPKTSKLIQSFTLKI